MLRSVLRLPPFLYIRCVVQLRESLYSETNVSYELRQYPVSKIKSLYSVNSQFLYTPPSSIFVWVLFGYWSSRYRDLMREIVDREPTFQWDHGYTDLVPRFFWHEKIKDYGSKPFTTSCERK